MILKLTYRFSQNKNFFKMDLKRAIIILMALACILDLVGLVHCHINYPQNSSFSAYIISYRIIFPILLSLTGFLLIEQLLITDGTVAPLNRLRTIFAVAAAVTLFFFGIGTAILASRWYDAPTQDSYHRNALLLGAVIASTVAFVDMTVYFAETLARN
ncbi:unnamed protein product, partial [Rotaria magnacalcarata]